MMETNELDLVEFEARIKAALDPIFAKMEVDLKESLDRLDAALDRYEQRVRAHNASR